MRRKARELRVHYQPLVSKRVACGAVVAYVHCSGVHADVTCLRCLAQIGKFPALFPDRAD